MVLFTEPAITSIPLFRVVPEVIINDPNMVFSLLELVSKIPLLSEVLPNE